MACDKVDVLLKFLLPYSPDYNPIEFIFKDLKAWIKSNYLLAIEFNQFQNFLELTIQSICRKDIQSHFQIYDYVVRG